MLAPEITFCDLWTLVDLWSLAVHFARHFEVLACFRRTLRRWLGYLRSTWASAMCASSSERRMPCSPARTRRTCGRLSSTQGSAGKTPPWAGRPRMFCCSFTFFNSRASNWQRDPSLLVKNEGMTRRIHWTSHHVWGGRKNLQQRFTPCVIRVNFTQNTTLFELAQSIRSLKFSAMLLGKIQLVLKYPDWDWQELEALHFGPPLPPPPMTRLLRLAALPPAQIILGRSWRVSNCIVVQVPPSLSVSSLTMTLCTGRLAQLGVAMFCQSLCKTAACGDKQTSTRVNVVESGFNSTDESSVAKCQGWENFFTNSILNSTSRSAVRVINAQLVPSLLMWVFVHFQFAAETLCPIWR